MLLPPLLKVFPLRNFNKYLKFQISKTCLKFTLTFTDYTIHCSCCFFRPIHIICIFTSRHRCPSRYPGDEAEVGKKKKKICNSFEREGGFPNGSAGKESYCNSGDVDSTDLGMNKEIVLSTVLLIGRFLVLKTKG